MDKKKKKTSQLWILSISQQFSDILLKSEGYEETLKVPKVRAMWHLLFFSVNGHFLAKFLILPLMNDYLISSEILTLYFRIFLIFWGTWLLILLTILAYYHYQLLIFTGKDLRFSNIAFFYFVGILFYGYIYRVIYIFNQNLFSYLNPVIVLKSVATRLPFFDAFIFSLDFIVYSACTSLSLSYYRISSSSSIVSIINIIQIISTLLIIVLLIATFVQKKTMHNNGVE